MRLASQHGMTLIELMVTVAVIAILAGIAYPGYQDQVRRSRRSAATAWLMEVAARQQQRFVDVRSYAGSYDVLGLTTPREIAGHYTITVTSLTAPPRFTATATPSGGQTKDKCGALTINQAGTKTAAGTAPNCW